MIDDPAANPTAEAEKIPEKRPVKFINAKKRNKAEIELDKLVIAKLYLEQKTQLQIADWIRRNRPYNLSVAVISGILKALFQEWRTQAVHKIDELKARDLAKLLDLEATATEAWQRSLLTSEKTTHEHDGSEPKPEFKKNGKPYKTKPHLRVSVVKENRDGDPRFLEIILKCIAQRSEILGYKPNRKIDEGGEDAPIILSVEVNNALAIAYGSPATDTNKLAPRTVDEVRNSGGGPWSPPGSVYELGPGTTDSKPEAT